MKNNQNFQIFPKKFSEKSDAAQERTEHLFKRLLVACCDSCERRASVHQLNCCEEEGHSDENHDVADENDEDQPDGDEETPHTFECDEVNKAEIHDVSSMG